jgi:hypothetical protein
VIDPVLKTRPRLALTDDQIASAGRAAAP